MSTEEAIATFVGGILCGIVMSAIFYWLIIDDDNPEDESEEE